MIKKAAYFFRQGIKNIKRRLSSSLVSICVVAAVFLIIGVFISVGLNVNVLARKLGDSCEINVYMAEVAPASPMQNVEEELRKIQGVKNVRFCSKDERLAKVTEDVYGEEENLFADGVNPLRDSYIVTAYNLSDVQRISEDVKAVDGVEEIVINSDIISAVNMLLRVLRSIGVILVIIFILLATLIVSGAIRLGMASSEEEIKIMKIVGATDGFITAPFVIQGVVLGIAGALVAIAITALGYEAVAQRVDYIISTDLVTLVATSRIVLVITPIFVVSGAVLGALGSLSAARKYLK